MRFATPPRDPRARLVLSAEPIGGTGLSRLKLACGHEAVRKLRGDVPVRVICVICPPAGGLAGNRFDHRRVK